MARRAAHVLGQVAIGLALVILLTGMAIGLFLLMFVVSCGSWTQ